MERHRYARLAAIASLAVWASWVSATPQAPRDLEALMKSVGDRVAEYYGRAHSIVCLERSVVQPIQSNWTPEGIARTVESELRVEADAADGDRPFSARVIREIHRINGRAPRERDKKDRNGCTDPNPLSPEPLAFLLPEHRDEYRFTSFRNGSEKNRPALIIEFMSANRISRPELIEDERGHDDCFDWSGPLAGRGKVWVDAATHDVLRVDCRLDGPVDVQVPVRLQRRFGFGPWVVIERQDQTMRYKPVAFSDPHEVMLLPESIESLIVLRGGLQSTRRTERFSGYRRFMTAGRVVKDLDP